MQLATLRKVERVSVWRISRFQCPLPKKPKPNVLGIYYYKESPRIYNQGALKGCFLRPFLRCFNGTLVTTFQLKASKIETKTGENPLEKPKPWKTPWKMIFSKPKQSHSQVRGIVAMANEKPNENGSQFYVLWTGGFGGFGWGFGWTPKRDTNGFCYSGFGEKKQQVPQNCVFFRAFLFLFEPLQNVIVCSHESKLWVRRPCRDTVSM